MRLSLSTLLVSCAATCPAQVVVTLPAVAATRDGDSIGSGFDILRRQQILLDQRELTPLLGRDLRELRFRRDGGRLDLRPGLCRVTVSLSTSSTIDARRPSPVFAANHGANLTVVARSIVTLPAAAALIHRDAASWDAPDAVLLPFTTPFRYTGGTLCIQIDAEPVSGSQSTWWPVDRHRDGQGGQARTIGTGCGPTAARVARTATVDTFQLVPGSAPRVIGLAEVGSAALLGIAGNELVPPIDLAFLGATGCHLYVLPALGLAAAVQPGLSNRPGVASVDLALPPDAVFLGATLYAQWTFWSGGLTTSNALALQLSSTPPRLQASTVEAAGTTALPTSGRIEIGTIPVVQVRT